MQMNNITAVIQAGLKRVATASFSHLHDLDLNYHRQSSKNTVFAINRALRSIDSSLRFVLGFFAPVAVEFFLLSGALFFQCGARYLANMLLTFGLYTWYTRWCSTKRIKEIAAKMKMDKSQEFYQNESIMNYETVK